MEEACLNCNGMSHLLSSLNTCIIFLFIIILITVLHLYTRYPIVARRAWPTVQPLGRVRRASKGILHTSTTFNIVMIVSPCFEVKTFFT